MGVFVEAHEHNLGRQELHRVSSSMRQASQKGDVNDNQKKDLEGAATAITDLKNEIAKFFPEGEKDSYIANCIRRACQGEALVEVQVEKSQDKDEQETKRDIQDKIYALTCLLFKTEV